MLNYKNYGIKIGDNEVAQRVILMKDNNQVEKGYAKGELRLIAKELGVEISNSNRQVPTLTTHELGKNIYDKLVKNIC